MRRAASAVFACEVPRETTPAVSSAPSQTAGQKNVDSDALSATLTGMPRDAQSSAMRWLTARSSVAATAEKNPRKIAFLVAAAQIYLDFRAFFRRCDRDARAEAPQHSSTPRRDFPCAEHRAPPALERHEQRKARRRRLLFLLRKTELFAQKRLHFCKAAAALLARTGNDERFDAGLTRGRELFRKAACRARVLGDKDLRAGSDG